jgi:hypothetical protein
MERSFEEHPRRTQIFEITVLASIHVANGSQDSTVIRVMGLWAG